MDLVTLIAACALSLEPKLMHALIWEQSGGEPWSFSLPGESQPRVYATQHDALRAARSEQADGDRIRIGLAGLPADPASATAVMFEPCTNIAVAARQVERLAERCKTANIPAEPLDCAIAAYRGSWERPDGTFARAVRATVAKGNAPNFDMPKDASLDAANIELEAPTRGPNVGAANPTHAQDRQRAWSSALFPAKRTTADGLTTDPPNADRAAEQSRATGDAAAHATAQKRPADSLFAPRSLERRRQ